MLQIIDSLLVEKCINTMVAEYRCNSQVSEDEISKYKYNALVELKLSFTQFILDNCVSDDVMDKQVVDYGIMYMKDTYPEEYKIVYSIICEYINFGTTRYLNSDIYAEIKYGQNNTCRPLPPKAMYGEHEVQDNTKKSLWSYIKNCFKNKR